MPFEITVSHCSLKLQSHLFFISKLQLDSSSLQSIPDIWNSKHNVFFHFLYIPQKAADVWHEKIKGH